MKDKEYDAIYADLISGRVDAANKVIQFAEALLVSILERKAAAFDEIAGEMASVYQAVHALD